MAKISLGLNSVTDSYGIRYAGVDKKRSSLRVWRLWLGILANHTPASKGVDAKKLTSCANPNFSFMAYSVTESRI